MPNEAGVVIVGASLAVVLRAGVAREGYWVSDSEGFGRNPQARRWQRIWRGKLSEGKVDDVESSVSAMFHESASKPGTNARGRRSVPIVRNAARAITGEPSVGGVVWIDWRICGGGSAGRRKCKGCMGFGTIRCSAGVWNRCGGGVVFFGGPGSTAENAGGTFSTNTQVTDRQYYCGSGEVGETRNGG